MSNNASYRNYQIVSRPDTSSPKFAARMEELERILKVKGYTFTKDNRGVVATPPPSKSEDEQAQSFVINLDTVLGIFKLFGI